MDGSEILSLLFYSPDKGDGQILAAGNNKCVNIYSIRTGMYIDTLRDNTDSVTCMAIEANMLFTGSDDTNIGIWDLIGKGWVGKLEGHKDSKSHHFDIHNLILSLI